MNIINYLISKWPHIFINESLIELIEAKIKNESVFTIFVISFEYWVNVNKDLSNLRELLLNTN